MAVVETSQPEVPWVPRNTFGMRLLMLRKHLGASAEHMATLIGVSQPTWSMWEGDASSPRNQAEVVTKIADATGVDRNWLMWGNSPTNCDYGVTSQPSLFDYLEPAELGAA